MQNRLSIIRVLFIPKRLNSQLEKYPMQRCFHKLQSFDSEKKAQTISNVDWSFIEKIVHYLSKNIEPDRNETIHHELSTAKGRMVKSYAPNYSDSSYKRSSAIDLSPQDDVSEMIDYKNTSNSEILRSLIALAKYNPNVATTKFYEECISVLTNAAHREKLTTTELLLLIYVLSWKKTSVFEIKKFLSLLPDISYLSLFEKCILAESTFRLSIPLKQRDLQCLEETIEEEAQSLMKDKRSLVMLIKAIRLGKTSKTFVPSKLSAAIVDSTSRFNLPEATHILVLYAEISFAEPRVMKRLISDAMKIYASLEQKTFKPMKFWLSQSNYKLKYLNNLLFSASKLNYKFEKHELDLITRMIENCYSLFATYPAMFSNILLSLWTMNHKLEVIVQKFLDEEKFIEIYGTDKWKSKARLNTLITCIKIEAPHIKTPAGTPNLPFNLTQSDKINEIFLIVEQIAKQFDLSDIKINFPVDHIYIPGVSFKHPILGLAHIDLLDEEVCLKFTREPNGLMHLKQRLLKRLGYVSLFVDKTRITDSVTAFRIIEDIIKESISVE